MSSLPDNFPRLPASVDGHELPNFTGVKIIQKGVKMPTPPALGSKFDFSIKQSDMFGTQSGDKFDEGSKWFPLKALHFTATDSGLASYRGEYHSRKTGLFGKLGDKEDHKIALDKDEWIIGISGTYTDRVTGLQVLTTKATHKLGAELSKASGKTFTFEVPKDHHVVAFHGRADDHIRAIGVSYSRRLATIAPTASDDPQMEIKPIYSTLLLDADTQAAFNRNDMDHIYQQRQRAKTDVAPLYKNIQVNGTAAWDLVENQEGEQFYLCQGDGATMWVYARDIDQTTSASESTPPNVTTKMVSLGSYSVATNSLGISGYVMGNTKTLFSSVAIAGIFMYFMKGVITDGIAWGLEYGATQLAVAAASMGVEEFAIAIPFAVASAGGLLVTGIIGVAVFFVVLELENIFFKKFVLQLNIYNFDPDNTWNTVNWYGDNATVSNGEWKPASLGPFVKAGSQFTPGGFEPVKTLENSVTYLAATFDNDRTFLDGVGVAVSLQSQDTAGNQPLSDIGVKYIIHAVQDNQIGIQIIGDTSYGALTNFYNGNWLQANNIHISDGPLSVTGSTPALDGASDNTYEYNVNIGTPPPPTPN